MLPASNVGSGVPSGLNRAMPLRAKPLATVKMPPTRIFPSGCKAETCTDGRLDTLPKSCRSGANVGSTVTTCGAVEAVEIIKFKIIVAQTSAQNRLKKERKDTL